MNYSKSAIRIDIFVLGLVLILYHSSSSVLDSNSDGYCSSTFISSKESKIDRNSESDTVIAVMAIVIVTVMVILLAL